MTKEELKQEAESKLDEWSDPDMGCCEGYCYSEVADFMFRFSEPREKRIEELEKAFIAGAILKHCVGKSCIDCENYNGVNFYDEWNRPQISCRLGGYHCGVEACDDFRRYDEDDEDWEK